MSEFKKFYKIDKQFSECQDSEILNFYRDNNFAKEIYNQIQKTDLSKEIVIVWDKDVGKCQNMIIQESLGKHGYEIKVESKDLLGLKRWKYLIWKRL